MKKVKLYMTVLSVALLSLSSCNDEWKDELYTHMVSLKAPVGSEEVADIYLRYSANGEVVYHLPVLVSGSTLMDNGLNVRIGVDNDTLARLNQDAYMSREDLYYQQLTEDYFEFLSPTCHIPAGSNKELFDIKFKFSGLNLSKEWVLPLTIEEDPSYVTNKRKGWRKALLHILPFNDYSGKYSASSMNLYLGESNDNPLVVDQRKAHVVDENTVFFYVGTQEDKSIHRETYKINVKFETPLEQTETKKKGNVTVTPADPANPMQFEIIGQPTYEIWDEKDTNQPYLVHRYHVIYMKYKYKDITSVEGKPIPYHAEGSLTMERKINTLIPDQDQAIQW